jgi:hypothetical protein
MNELMDSNEAAECDANITVYYTEPATVPQQIVSAVIATLAPLAVGLGTMGLIVVAGAVTDKVKTHRANRKAAKEANTIVIKETTPTE